MMDRLHLAMAVGAPDWTERNDADPGITMLDLHGFLTAGRLFGGDASDGKVNGLAEQSAAVGSGGLHVSPGLAVSPDGRVIDLAALVSRYIGETEKNLASRFGDASPSDAVLRDDDADALFDRKP